MNVMIERNLATTALLESFAIWGSKNNDKRWRKLYAETPRELHGVLADFLTECDIHKPGMFWHWWCSEREKPAYRAYREEDKRKIRELVNEFLGLYIRGKIHEAIDNTAVKKVQGPKGRRQSAS